jgi:selenocysteine-specific elongation factor
VGVSLTLLESAKRLKQRARVHFHSYANESIAEVTLHGYHELFPGKTGFAQLRFSEAALLLPGDRFIIRQFSPVVTIGGGVVLDNVNDGETGRLKEQALSILAAKNEPDSLMLRIRRRGMQGVSVKTLIAETGMRAAEIEARLASSFPANTFPRFGERLLFFSQLMQLEEKLVEAVSEFQKNNPLAPGISKGQLRERLKLKLRDEVFEGALLKAVGEKKLQLQSELVKVAGQEIKMKSEEAESKTLIERAFATAGLKVPALQDVLAGLKIDKARARNIVTLLLREGTLVKLSDELVFHRDALGGLKKSLSEQKAKSDKLDVARFKEMTGITRKYAIPLLEWLDREHVTRRVGDARVIL